MRVLTKQERKAFQIAFMCVDRLNGIGQDENIDQWGYIDVTGNLQPLPERLKSVFTKFQLENKKLNSFYSPYFLNKKEFNKFVSGCFKQKIQPKEFYFNGLLCKREDIATEMEF